MKKTISIGSLLFVAVFICGLFSTSTSMPIDGQVYADHQKPAAAKKMIELSADGGNKIEGATLVVEEAGIGIGRKEVLVESGQNFLTSAIHNNRPQYLHTEDGWQKVVSVKEYGRNLCDEIKTRCLEPEAEPEPVVAKVKTVHVSAPKPEPEPVEIPQVPCEPVYDGECVDAGSISVYSVNRHVTYMDERRIPLIIVGNSTARSISPADVID